MSLVLTLSQGYAMLTLPPEVWRLVVLQLGFEEVKILAQVCRLFSDLVFDRLRQDLQFWEYEAISRIAAGSRLYPLGSSGSVWICVLARGHGIVFLATHGELPSGSLAFMSCFEGMAIEKVCPSSGGGPSGVQVLKHLYLEDDVAWRVEATLREGRHSLESS